jgi:hypothetical protein
MPRAMVRIIMTDDSIIWRRLDVPGHEACRVISNDFGWRLAGTAVFVYSQQPCRLDYSIKCNSNWLTLSATVVGWVGNESVDIEIFRDSEDRWRLNSRDCAEVTGCIDIDLNFSPSTNLLPIRRLNLAVGQAAQVRATWLRFPSFVLEPLDQAYLRLDSTTYRYESADGKFIRHIQVNSNGLVTDYPNFWTLEQST